MVDLSHIATWVFDLDNTLYPAECNLFAQVDKRMASYIANALSLSLPHARFLQKDYYKRYGTTLNGLMKLHDLKPEPFLDYVHDIDLSVVAANPALKQVLATLPGRKFIYTNGSRGHAERVAERLGILEIFEDITDITSNGYCAKPEPEAYRKFLAHHDAHPSQTIMFDDMPHNLEAPHQLGMVTVLVHSSYVDHPEHAAMKRWSSPPDHIHHHTKDVTTFLRQAQV